MEFVKHHRSYQSIACFAAKLNLASRNKGWSKEEDARLIEYYNTHDKINMTEILTLFPNRTKGSLLNRAVTLKLSRAKHYWTVEEDTIVLQYSVLGDKVLDQLPGISKMQLMQRASKLGIKNPNYKKQNLIQHITDEQQKLLQDYYSDNNWNELYKLFPDKSKRTISKGEAHQ
jgi:hypothetical protein